MPSRVILPLTLKLYSDFICPFCYIAEHSTVERLVREYDVVLDWRGFELHPDTPPGGMPLKDLFPGRDLPAMHRHVQGYGRKFGVELPDPPKHLPNSRKALAVAEYARKEGKLDPFRRAMMHAYWKDGKDLEDPAVLKSAAKTAGLDPEERLRFYQLLAELAADRIVLLSTHIVEDVAVLCPRFAVIREGRLLALTTPSEARGAISGHVYEGTVDAADLPQLRSERTVTQALLVEGRNRARIYEPKGNPPSGFTQVAVTLEDAYLVLMRLGELPGLAREANGIFASAGGTR